MEPIRLMTFNPGHFHAALVQKEMLPGVDARVHIYAPLGPDLLAHLSRLTGFNTRSERPTCWQVEVHAGEDALARMVSEKPGQVVILAGRNRDKLDALEAAVDAGLHVLADKPLILEAAELPRLARILHSAVERHLVAQDMLTERHEITNLLQRELINDAEIFGEPVAGTPDEPAVYIESVHCLLKQVAGEPLRRPPWFFDIAQHGEGLTDVGIHLVDLVQWMLFPLQPPALEEIELLSARRWPTRLSRADFSRVTGLATFPDFLRSVVHTDHLDYVCNNLLVYRMRGRHIKLNVLWDLSRDSGDTHFASVRGSRARIEIRQEPSQNHVPEVYVIPQADGARNAVLSALRERLRLLQSTYPGLTLADRHGEWQLVIPSTYRLGHEAHFALVLKRFLEQVRQPENVLAHEQQSLLSRYGVTTRGVALARKTGLNLPPAT